MRFYSSAYFNKQPRSAIGLCSKEPSSLKVIKEKRDQWPRSGKMDARGLCTRRASDFLIMNLENRGCKENVSTGPILTINIDF